jgi:hypothetical protein
VFPNDAAIERLVTAVIVEQHDEWAVTERRYLSETSMTRLRHTAPAIPATTSKRKPLASRPPLTIDPAGDQLLHHDTGRHRQHSVANQASTQLQSPQSGQPCSVAT